MKTKEDIGHPCHLPCKVCSAHDENQQEASRFFYTVCKKHRDVPPAYLEDAARQYEALGFTDWDQ
jgi:hypothetical protein